MTRKPGSKMTASECLARIAGGDIIQCVSHSFPDAGSACLRIKPKAAGQAPDVENKIETMKDWSASEEAFRQPDGFDLAFPFWRPKGRDH